MSAIFMNKNKKNIIKQPSNKTLNINENKNNKIKNIFTNNKLKKIKIPRPYTETNKEKDSISQNLIRSKSNYLIVKKSNNLKNRDIYNSNKLNSASKSIKKNKKIISGIKKKKNTEDKGLNNKNKITQKKLFNNNKIKLENK